MDREGNNGLCCGGTGNREGSFGVDPDAVVHTRLSFFFFFSFSKSPHQMTGICFKRPIAGL